MDIQKTSLDSIAKYRNEYFRGLPEFQELYIELMMPSAECFLLKTNDLKAGYAIKNEEGVLIEFYLTKSHLSKGFSFFEQVVKQLSITNIYCKSFDTLLLNYCLLSAFKYSALGVLFRNYNKAHIEKDPNLDMQKAGLGSVDFLLNQEESIRELFETKQQLIGFIENVHVFMFTKNNELIGCGTVISTHKDWNYCDLGVWVNPLKRGLGFGSQILLHLRDFALANQSIPSCGCAVDNIASQKAIKKSGYVCKHVLINFQTK